MDFSIQRSMITGTLTVTCCVFNLPAIASQIWQGEGEILSGPGQGGTVELELVVDDRQIKFLSGPSRNNQVELEGSNRLNGSVETDTGTWKFSQSNQELEVTLYQDDPYRVIRYYLERQ